MELKKLTWDDFPNPCYSPQERYGNFNGTILDILKDDRIPDDDKIWAATRRGILDDKTLRLFACKCVREVWHLLKDERSRNAVEVTEKYANGQATNEELTDARAAAWAAAWAADAARAAAWAADAARDARAAARAADAAWAADAARDARAAARAADAAWAKQVQILIELIHQMD